MSLADEASGFKTWRDEDEEKSSSEECVAAVQQSEELMCQRTAGCEFSC